MFGVFIASVAGLATCQGQTHEAFRKDISRKENLSPVLDEIDQLKLEDLQHGYDSLQLRIWYQYELMGKGKVLVLSNRNSTWKGTLFSFDLGHGAGAKGIFKLTVTRQAKKDLRAKSGWEKYVDQLNVLQLMTLPSMKDIPHLKDGWTDGAVYCVEISTRNLYRFYSYHVPAKFQEFPQAQNMVNILELTKKELGIPWEEPIDR